MKVNLTSRHGAHALAVIASVIYLESLWVTLIGHWVAGAFLAASGLIVYVVARWKG